MWKVAKKHMTYLHFLPPGVAHTQDEIEQANALFDYVFNNKKLDKVNTTNEANQGLSQNPVSWYRNR